MNSYGSGALPSPRDIRDYKLSAAVQLTEKFPITFQLSPAKIKNQGTHPTCVAHALASLVEYYNVRDTKNYNRFSTDFIYGCRTDDDYLGEGMYLRDGLKVIQKYGDVLYKQLPGNTDVPTARQKVFANFDELVSQAAPNRISTYYKICSLNELKHALIHGGPVPACIALFEDGDIDSNGVYYYSSKEVSGYHAVLVIGWDENNLIIQNSWGASWGNHGLFYIPISKMDEVVYEFYGVTDNISDVVQPSPVVNRFSSLINFILRLIDMIFKN